MSENMRNDGFSIEELKRDISPECLSDDQLIKVIDDIMEKIRDHAAEMLRFNGEVYRRRNSVKRFSQEVNATIVTLMLEIMKR